MKQPMNSNALNESGDVIITRETKKKSKKSEWLIIGGKKVWARKCNHCGNTVYHTSISRFYISSKHNAKCEKCRQNGENNSFYGHVFTDAQRQKWSLCRMGEKNAMFGTTGGMFGKKHSKSTIQKQQQARRGFWKKIGHGDRTKFERYRWEVDRLTRHQPINTLSNHDKRGKAGKEGAYHLDHVISVWYGYHNNIPETDIASISNLRFIPWLENQKKWYK